MKMNLCQCSFSEEHKDIYKYFFNHVLFSNLKWYIIWELQTIISYEITFHMKFSVSSYKSFPMLSESFGEELHICT